MKIINHRCNNLGEVLRSMDGAEIDLRVDQGTGRITLTHDPLSGAPRLDDLVQLLQVEKRSLTLLLNVKECGLANQLARTMSACSQAFYCTDVPGQELPQYWELGLPVLARLSEHEYPRALNKCAGIYVDPFNDVRMESLLNFAHELRADYMDRTRPIVLVDATLRGRRPFTLPRDLDPECPWVDMILTKEYKWLR